MYSPCHTWKHLNMSQGGGQIRESIGLSLTVGIWVLSMELLKAVLSDSLRCARCLVTAPSLILSLTLGLGGKYELDLEKKRNSFCLSKLQLFTTCLSRLFFLFCADPRPKTLLFFASAPARPLCSVRCLLPCSGFWKLGEEPTKGQWSFIYTSSYL
jgi:hypothetical protein